MIEVNESIAFLSEKKLTETDKQRSSRSPKSTWQQLFVDNSCSYSRRTRKPSLVVASLGCREQHAGKRLALREMRMGESLATGKLLVPELSSSFASTLNSTVEPLLVPRPSLSFPGAQKSAIAHC